MPVCIAGMHRSGTSMVAKLLNQSGIYLGTAAEVIPASPDNLDGHWEHVRFVALNDEILNELGAGWDCPPPPTADWKRLLTLPRIRRKADALLAEFSGCESWGWKDPRASLTLRFWLELCPELKVIICVRNPLEVAVSLKRRGLSSYAFGLRLWLRYNQRLLEDVAPSRRLVTHYAGVLSRPQEEVRRMLDFLNISAAPGIVEGASTSAREQLRHNRFTTRDLLSAEIAPDMLQLYQELCDSADWSEDVRGEAFSASRRQAAAADGRPVSDDREWLGAAVLDASALDAELLRRERDDLSSAAAAKHTSIRDLQARSETQSEVLRKERDDQRAAMAKLEEVIASRDQDLAGMRSNVEQLEAALSDERSRRQRLEASAERDYERLKRRVLGLIDETVPRGATVWMVSRGDEALIRLNGRRSGHFPQTPRGDWAGHHPADSAEAIAHLETLRANGGAFLVFPATALWWLEHYAEFRTYLQTRYRTVVDREDTGIIFEVSDLAWQRQMGAAIARFQKRFARDPAILDWNSGLQLAAVFPHATVFGPPEAASTLPYLDCSVDIVVCPQASAAVAEARRVASGMVVTISQGHAGKTARGGRAAGQVTVRSEWVAQPAPRWPGRARGSMRTGGRTGSAAVRSGSRQPRGQR